MVTEIKLLALLQPKGFLFSQVLLHDFKQFNRLRNSSIC